MLALKAAIWEVTIMHNWQLSPKKLSKFIVGVIALAVKLIIDGSKFSKTIWYQYPCGMEKLKLNMAGYEKKAITIQNW